MSNEEEMASIGRLVVEAKESNQRLVAIEAALGRAAADFRAMGDLLSHTNRTFANNSVDDPKIDKLLASLISKDKLESLINEARTENERYAGLRKQQSSLGL